MKKLISLLLTFVIITVAYIPFATGYFIAQDSNVLEEKNEVSSNMCCEWWEQKLEQKEVSICNDWWICSDGNICECCIAPFPHNQYSLRSDNVNIKQKIKKIKILDFTFIDLFKDTLSINLVSRLNSPPKKINSLIPKKSYITLTGSIKSNC